VRELADARLDGGHVAGGLVCLGRGMVGERVGRLFLVPADRFEGRLDGIGVLKRTADRARGAIGHGGGQLGAHAVNARLAHVKRRCP
jgi:hypothetical protein